MKSLVPSFCSSIFSFTLSLPLFQIRALSYLPNLLSLPLNALSCGAVYFRWRGADGLGYTTRLCKIIAASSINFEHVMTRSFHPIVAAGLESRRYELNICCSLLLFKKIIIILLASAVRDCISACLVWPKFSNRYFPIVRRSDLCEDQELFYVVPKHWK